MPRTRNVLLLLLAAIAAGHAGPWLRTPAGTPVAVRQAEARLAAKAPVINWTDTPFAEACADVGRWFGVPVRIEADALRAAGVDPDAVRVNLRTYNVRGSKVLDLVMQAVRRPGGQTIRGMFDDDGTFLVTTDLALRRRAVADWYDCAPLLGDAPERPPGPPRREGPTTRGLHLDPFWEDPHRDTLREQISVLVTETVDPDSWRDTGGRIGQLAFAGDRLWVVHEPERQREFRQLMEQLGEQANAPTPETIADRLTHPSGRGWQRGLR